MAGGNPAVLPRAEQASSSTAVEEASAEAANLADRVRSLRLASIPQGSDWFRSLVLLVVGIGFLGLLYYLIRETLQANKSNVAGANAAADSEPAKEGDDSAGGEGPSSDSVVAKKPV